jgi:hypothetical protein
VISDKMAINYMKVFVMQIPVKWIIVIHAQVEFARNAVRDTITIAILIVVKNFLHFF